MIRRALLTVGLLAVLWLPPALADERPTPPRARPAAETVRQAVDEELATGDYIPTIDERQRAYTRILLLQKLANSITGFLHRFAGRIRLPGLSWLSGMSGIGTVLLIAAGLVVFGLLGWLVYILVCWIRVQREERLRLEAELASVGRGAEERDLLAMSARRALLAARKAADGGDLRAAFRFAFYALLLWLREAGHLELDLRRTNREYLGMLDAELPERDLYRRSLEQFERKWYGLQPVLDFEYADLEAAVRPLVTAERRAR